MGWLSPPVPCFLNGIRYIDTMDTLRIIPLFDRYLSERGLVFEGIAVGGAALALLGLISRETRDCDVLEPQLPGAILEASTAFAQELGTHGVILRKDWLNNGPASLAELLPNGWRDRVQELYRGQAITLWSLGRSELLMSKLFALCDRATDLTDCLALQPTMAELEAAVAWLMPQDLHPGWSRHVRATIDDLARRLGHGL